MVPESKLLKRIEAFLSAHPEVSESGFGFHAANDRQLIADLRGGRELRLATRERIKLFMRSYRKCAA